MSNDNPRWLLNGQPVDDETNAQVNAQRAEGCKRCGGLGFCPPWFDDNGKITEESDKVRVGEWDCHMCNGSGRKDGDRDKSYGVFEPRNVRDAKSKS